MQNSSASSFWDSCDLLGSLAWTKILLLAKTPQFGRWGKHQNKIRKKNNLFWLERQITHTLLFDTIDYMCPLPIPVNILYCTSPSLYRKSLWRHQSNPVQRSYSANPVHSWQILKTPLGSQMTKSPGKELSEEGLQFQIASILHIHDHIRICLNKCNEENYILSWWKTAYV